MNRQLIEAMLGDDYRDLYMHEAWFKVAIDQIAEFVIPALVRGLAIEGSEKHWERERLIEEVMRTPNPFWPPTGSHEHWDHP